ncbi:hypothetical protein A9Q84_20240 [Halobacteriovorax marinus]|uniref:Uncharacterized protein n=1 Tax=Halobacteriovorax marinus TaxID=97084 RepID=A0A1Y5F1P2_9BACT|nr:hypothetical protein A9Q84_20240 [Halobacteriovorax marinus]
MKPTIILLALSLSTLQVQAQDKTLEEKLTPLRTQFLNTLTTLDKTNESSLSTKTKDRLIRLAKNLRSDFMSLENIEIDLELERLKQDFHIDMKKKTNCFNKCEYITVLQPDLPFYLQSESRVSSLKIIVNKLSKKYADSYSRIRSIESTHYVLGRELQKGIIHKTDLISNMSKNIKSIQDAKKTKDMFANKYGLKTLFNPQTNKFSWDIELLVKKTSFISFKEMDKETKDKYYFHLAEYENEMQSAYQPYFTLMSEGEHGFIINTITSLDE